jgi:hypothetical protein
MTTKTRSTFNKRLILDVLTVDDFDGIPPHPVSYIFYMLETAFNHKWEGIYEGMKTKPSLNQIRRTLRALANEGLVVSSKVKNDGDNNRLPYWELEWQLSGDVYRNTLIKECQAVYRKVNRAKNGAALFASVFDMGLPANEVKPLMDSVKALMQKTHPDKADGYAEQFKQMKQCAKWIRAGIPLPTPIHTAGENVNITLTFPK